MAPPFLGLPGQQGQVGPAGQAGPAGGVALQHQCQTRIHPPGTLAQTHAPQTLALARTQINYQTLEMETCNYILKCSIEYLKGCNYFYSISLSVAYVPVCFVLLVV